MKKDGLVLTLVILNVIGITFLFAYIFKSKPEEVIEKPIIEPIPVALSTSCRIDKSDEGVTNFETITLNHTDNLLTSIYFEYNLSLTDNAKFDIYNAYKMDIEQIISLYRSEPSINIVIEDVSETYYNLKFENKLDIPLNNKEIIPQFTYKQNINDVINNYVTIGYTCE